MLWIQEYFKLLWELFLEMSPWLLLGFLFSGILKVFFPEKSVAKQLGKPTFLSTLKAVILGIPMPLCSCGVIPTGVYFYKQGASKGATNAFLISTPQTGVDSIFATYALLGLPFAILRPLIAFVSGIFGGNLTHLFTKSEPIQNMAESEVKTQKNLKEVFTYGFGTLIEDLVKWLMIGLLLAAFIGMIIPDDFFTQNFSNPVLEMLLVLLASIPLYVCATGSIPIAAVLLLKGLSPGAALLFLMAGPATNVATMLVLSKTLGNKSLVLYLVSIVFSALFFGFCVNAFLPESWFIGSVSKASHMHLIPHNFSILCAVFLSILLLRAIYQRYLHVGFFKKSNSIQNSDDKMENSNIQILEVKGMSCNHCKASVEKGVGAISGVQKVEVELSSGKVSIEGESVDIEKVKGKIIDLGFEL